MKSKSTIAIVVAVGCVGVMLLFGHSGILGAKQPPNFNPVGTWFGNAVGADGYEVIMTPTFFGDGNVIANDSHELLNPHGTSHGTWKKTGPHSIMATFVWIQMDPELETPNGYLGAFKVRLYGELGPPADSGWDLMTGQVVATFFPVGTDPLDPDDVGGIPFGTVEIDKLQRVRVH